MLTRRKLNIAALSALLFPSFAFSSSYQKADVIVVGGGAAGLAAAARAAELGLSVILLEKEKTLGGNSLKASGYISGVFPVIQKVSGVIDTSQNYYEEILRNAGEAADKEKIRLLAFESTKSLEWLVKVGVRFQNQIFYVSGERFGRSYKPVLPNGIAYVRSLSEYALHFGTQIYCESKVSGFLKNSIGNICGVIAQQNHSTHYFYANRGVVLATGGFSANKDLIQKYAPQFAHLTHNNHPGATGDLLLEVQNLGGLLRDMDILQCQPGCPPGRTKRVRLHNEVDRFILFNQNGKRFIREDAPRNLMTQAVLSEPNQYAYILVDDEGFRSYNQLIQKETVLCIESGDAWMAESLKELEGKIYVPSKSLEQTILLYNRGVDRKKDEFGKSSHLLSHKIQTPPFWVGRVGMSRHATSGGVATSPFGRVLRKDGGVLEGLWAAGETVGGIHGLNQMGGNGLADAITFGRLAAEDIVVTNKIT